MGKKRPLPPLTPEQARLVEDHVHLVTAVLYSRFSPLPQHNDDFIEIGYIALCRAGILYNPNQGASFVTWAWEFIQKAMLKLMWVLGKYYEHYEQDRISLDQTTLNGEIYDESLHKVIAPSELSLEERAEIRDSIRQVATHAREKDRLYMSYIVHDYSRDELPFTRNVVDKIRSRLKKLYNQYGTEAPVIKEEKK